MFTAREAKEKIDEVIGNIVETEIMALIDNVFDRITDKEMIKRIIYWLGMKYNVINVEIKPEDNPKLPKVMHTNKPYIPNETILYAAPISNNYNDYTTNTSSSSIFCDPNKITVDSDE